MIQKAKNWYLKIDLDDQLLYKTVITNYFAKGITLVTNLIIIPLILNYLGAAKYGFLITLITILNWLLLFDLGIGNSVKNLVSQEYSEKNFETINSIFKNASLILFSIFIIFSIVTIYLIPLFNYQTFFNINEITEKELALIVTSSIILFLLNMFLSLSNNVFYGLQKGYIPNVFNAIGNIITLIVIYYAIIHNFSVLFIIITYVSGFLLGNLFTLIYLLVNKVVLPWKGKINKSQSKLILKLGIQFFSVSVIGIIIYSIDNIIITKVIGPSSVATYNPIMRLYQIIIQVNGLYLLSLWPAYTNAIAKKDFTWVKRKFKSSIKFVFYIFFPLVLILVIFGPKIISLWVGNNEHLPSQMLCLTIGIWTLIYLVNQATGIFLNGAGIMGQQIKFGIISILVFIISAFFLVSKYGLIGLSISGILSSMVGLIVNPYLIRKYLINN
jgi:O-antigen/teichoic acid export membrane protein